MASPSRKHQVSLRGSSSKEITRDALLEKVSFERELRNYTRRAAAAALFIQKVWRRYHAAKKVAKQFKEEWEILIGQHDILITSRWVSHGLLRPFLFFATRLSTASRIACTRCMLLCFRTVLQSIDSTDPKKNFCSMVTGTPDERSTWIYQARKLVSICSYILHECDHTFLANGENKIVTSLIMQLVIALTDPRSWKSFSKANHKDACIAARKLVQFIASGGSGLYTSVRRHIMKFCTPLEKQSGICTDDHFLITASALTLALRPFHVVELCVNYVDPTDVQDAAEQYCIFLLTVPLLSQCLPRVLLPALKHESVLSPCLRTLLISKEKLFIEMSKLDQLKDYTYCYNLIPSCGWALANMISLVTEQDNGSIESGHFIQGLQSRAYVHSAISFSENLLHQLENIGCLKNRENDEHVTSYVPLEKAISTDVSLSPAYSESSVVSYVEAIKPVYQQWHLLRLLAISKKDISVIEDSDKLDLIDVAVFYSNILRMVSFLDPLSGSWPLLNMLSFTPGILVELWRVLEASLFCQDYHRDVSGKHMDGVSVTHEVVTGKKLGRIEKDAGYKWTSVLQRITGKSSNNADSDQYINSTIDDTLVTDSTSDLWDVESMRQGSQGISKGISCLLHVFSVTYAHLLLVLDDIEFHEKQVPFSLEQQRKIVAVLNTLVYNGLSHNTGDQNKPLMDAAIRCLHLLYERDCRHQFCPSSLWIAPARKGRPPIAAASRAHEAVTANLKSVDTLAGSCPSSVINKIPHVFPFEERVQMFREFVNMDKVSRRMAGEVTGPGPGSIEIVVRRDHIVEDGFKQLNFLGAKLKSCINVSFVSECGLPEAGLDYGGLSKEFLTDISKTAFDPRYGLFSQTSTSERCLIPNNAAKSVDNGIQMIEFLGRVVGKALYEGILLDYSFSLVFVQKLLGRYSFLDELSTLDPELYRNLMYVKHYEGDVRELALDFTVTEELLGRLVVTELKPGGKNMTVTNENKLQYVHAIADYKLNRQILPLANAFFRGLIDLISPSWLSLFNAIEFNQLLSGGNHDFDVDDLKSNTRYTGGYSEGSRTIKLFWEVIKELEPKERCMLLKFVTSCSRAPLLGFKHLQPTFTIHKVICDVPLWAMIGGQDVDRLPSASTCYNTLKLPTYKRASTLRSKLLYAVNSNAGFELS